MAEVDVERSAAGQIQRRSERQQVRRIVALDCAMVDVATAWIEGQHLVQIGI